LEMVSCKLFAQAGLKLQSSLGSQVARIIGVSYCHPTWYCFLNVNADLIFSSEDRVLDSISDTVRWIRCLQLKWTCCMDCYASDGRFGLSW
jgi:hypothetical protein